MEHPETTDFTWDDAYLLGHPAMDDTHRAFVECVNALLTAPDEALPAALEAFGRHAEAHFAQEDEWMRSTDFPPKDCHLDEHAKVLASFHEVSALLADGHYEVVRDFARALVEWFPGHADYLDSALAAWMVKRSHDGRPLVFRRNKPA